MDMKDNLLELINLELQMMTDCSDIVNYSDLENLPKWYMYQSNRFYKITNELMKLTRMYIKEYKEIPKMESPKHTLYELPYVHSDNDIKSTFLTSWLDSETKILQLLETLYKENKNPLFKNFYMTHKTYHTTAEKCIGTNSIIVSPKKTTRERLKEKLESKNN